MRRKIMAVIILLTLLFSSGGAAVETAMAAETENCTEEQGQQYIDEGRYGHAIREFTCLIESQPTEVEGYRGRIEAELLLGRFSDAVIDYTRVTALVEPVHLDARSIILAGYDQRLELDPNNIAALTGASFAHWYYFEYAQAIQMLNHLLEVRPDDLYGNLFRGSTRLLLGPNPTAGMADLEYAISLAPESPDVHYVVADAYLYGRADYMRAYDEAWLALEGGLNTPRVHAILAGSYLAFGDLLAAASHIESHIELVTTELVQITPLAAGTSLTLDLVPGRTYEIPLDVVAGEAITIMTSSHDFTDTILVIQSPDGTPVVGNDDYRQYFAGIQWSAEVTGIYHLLATSFEGVSTGELIVARK